MQIYILNYVYFYNKRLNLKKIPSKNLDILEIAYLNQFKYKNKNKIIFIIFLKNSFNYFKINT